MSHETSTDPLGIHAVTAGPLPGSQNLRAHHIPRDRTRPVGQEGPPGRIEINGPRHPARLVTPRVSMTSHREASAPSEIITRGWPSPEFPERSDAVGWTSATCRAKVEVRTGQGTSTDRSGHRGREARGGGHP